VPKYVPRPNCPGAEVSRFFSILRHFGTGAEVSRAGPKCLVAEVSGNRQLRRAGADDVYRV